jgi:hypothetical protein
VVKNWGEKLKELNIIKQFRYLHMQTTLFSGTTGVLKEAIRNFSKSAKEMGLTINLQNTKYMEVTKRPTNSRKLKVDDQEFERLTELKYLESTLTEDNKIITEIHR